MAHGSTNVVHGGQSLILLKIFVVANAMYQCDGAVSGLLVSGRSGVGKTSIVQAVAKSLQEDTRTHSCGPYFST